jgi:hypothetical protein
MSYESANTGAGIDAAVDEVQAVSGDLVGTSDAQTITNKVIDPSLNTIDGDKLDIDWNPSNYTPLSSISEADDVDDLAAHLKGIDVALGFFGANTNILWVYKNTAMSGWAVKADVTDVVLAVKGGSEDYDVDGGNVAGSWTLGGLSGSSNNDTHRHQWYNHNPTASHQSYNSSGSPIAISTSGIPSTYEHITSRNDGGDGLDTDYYTSNDTHNHTISVSHDGTDRLRGAVGTLQYPDV